MKNHQLTRFTSWLLGISLLSLFPATMLWGFWFGGIRTTVTLVGCPPEARECRLPVEGEKAFLLFRFSQNGPRPTGFWELLRAERVQVQVVAVDGQVVFPTETEVALSQEIVLPSPTLDAQTYAKFGKLVLELSPEAYPQVPVVVKFFRPDGRPLGQVGVILERRSGF